MSCVHLGISPSTIIQRPNPPTRERLSPLRGTFFCKKTRTLVESKSKRATRVLTPRNDIWHASNTNKQIKPRYGFPFGRRRHSRRQLSSRFVSRDFPSVPGRLRSASGSLSQ